VDVREIALADDVDVRRRRTRRRELARVDC
jgi:hypothetical protein